MFCFLKCIFYFNFCSFFLFTLLRSMISTILFELFPVQEVLFIAYPQNFSLLKYDPKSLFDFEIPVQKKFFLYLSYVWCNMVAALIFSWYLLFFSLAIFV